MIKTPDSETTPVTLESYLMGREVKYASEYTSDVAMNAMQLLPRVNALLQDLGVSSVIVTSGWRPPSLNAHIPNAAPRSLHMVGKAVDLSDVEGKLFNLIIDHHPLLKKYELWVENRMFTPTWVHLDIGHRKEREVNIFSP